MNEKAFHAMSYGVYIVTSWDNGRPVGCTANCAAQITASPATVMVSVNKDNYTNKCIADCGHFALSILSENSSPEIIGRFGFQSSRDHDKFAETAYAVKNSLPVVSDSCAYICCKVVRYDGFSHAYGLSGRGDRRGRDFGEHPHDVCLLP